MPGRLKKSHNADVTRWRSLTQSSKVVLICEHILAELVDFLVCARPLGSIAVGRKGAVSPPGASALLLEAGAFPGS